MSASTPSRRRAKRSRIPKRNLPIAIIAALIIVTSLYVLVALTALGVQPAAEFEGQEAGLATILQNLTGNTGRRSCWRRAP